VSPRIHWACRSSRTHLLEAPYTQRQHSSIHHIHTNIMTTTNRNVRSCCLFVPPSFLTISCPICLFLSFLTSASVPSDTFLTFSCFIFHGHTILPYHRMSFMAAASPLQSIPGINTFVTSSGPGSLYFVGGLSLKDLHPKRSYPS
jgi:hypothetical protein